jgi:hypothetical protein
MRRCHSALLLLLILLSSTSSAIAAEPYDPVNPPLNANELCIIFISANLNFTRIEVIVDETLNATQFANISAQVDADADGNITSGEISVWENSTHEVVTDPEEIWELGARKVFLDSEAPYEVNFWNRLHRFEGPTNSTNSARLVQEMRQYEFKARAARQLHEDEEFAYNLSMLLTGTTANLTDENGDYWLIEWDDHDSNSLVSSGDEWRVETNSSDGWELEVRIYDHRAEAYEGGPLPGFDLVFLLVALAFAAVRRKTFLL